MKKILLFLLCISIFFTYISAGSADEATPLPQTAVDYAASDHARYAAKMAVGAQHIAVVKPDGTLAIWDDNNYEQLNVPSGLTDVKSVAAGLYHTLALTENGTVFAWGSVNTDNSGTIGSITIPSEVQSVQGHIKLIAAGGTMSAVVTDTNEVIVWGNNPDLSAIPAGLGNVVAIAINSNCAVALSEGDNVTVWGNSSCTIIPNGLSGNVVAIAAGQWHWLALKKDGTVAIVGHNSQLSQCQNIKNQTNVRAIAGGWQFAAALLADSSVQGWGRTPPSGFATGGKELIPASENIRAFSSTVTGGSTAATICAMKKDGTLVVAAPSSSTQNQIPANLNLLTMSSSNADLSNLAVAGYELTPAFITGTTDYTVNVPNDVSSVSISATTADTNASLQINGTAAASGASQTIDSLSVGNNQVDVLVTAEDGTTKTYSITVKRPEAPKSSNADLNGLTVVSTVYSVYYDLTPAFDATTTAYTINVPNGVVSVDITATTAYANAGLKINATDATSSVSQTVYGLTVGDNQIDIEVTAEDGTVKIYTLTIKQAGSFESGDADLSDLTVAGYALSPAFNSAITAYKVNVPNDVTSVNITATTADSKSSLKINGTGVASGSAWTVDNLTVGANQVAIEITAEDGTVKTYTFTIKRSDSTVVENEFNISNVQLLNPLNNEEIAVVMGQSGYRVQAQIDNNGAETIDGLVIIQVRYGTRATAEGGGKVLNCVGVSSGITATGSTVTSDFVLPSGLSGTAYVDVFVWNGWDAQVPLATANHNKSFTVSN